MAIEHENEDGTTVTVFTKEELEAEATARATAEASRIAAEKDAEIEKLRKVSAEKTENFRKYNDLTDEERKAHSENEIIQIRRADALAEELNSVKTALQQKEEKERGYMKESVFKGFHGGKDDIKKNLEEKYAVLAGMPETNLDEIKARASAAAVLAGISVESVNPLYQSYSGEAPQYKEKTDYVETVAGKEAADMVRSALGIKTDNK